MARWRCVGRAQVAYDTAEDDADLSDDEVIRRDLSVFVPSDGVDVGAEDITTETDPCASMSCDEGARVIGV